MSCTRNSCLGKFRFANTQIQQHFHRTWTANNKQAVDEASLWPFKMQNIDDLFDKNVQVYMGCETRNTSRNSVIWCHIRKQE